MIKHPDLRRYPPLLQLNIMMIEIILHVTQTRKIHFFNNCKIGGFGVVFASNYLKILYIIIVNKYNMLLIMHLFCVYRQDSLEDHSSYVIKSPFLSNLISA